MEDQVAEPEQLTEASWVAKHPAQFTEDRIKGGFAQIRATGIDLGPTRTVAVVIQATGYLGETKEQSQARLGTLAKDTASAAQSVDQNQDIMTKLKDMYKSMDKAVEIVAIYVIAWRYPADGGGLLSWVHPKAVVNEVGPLRDHIALLKENAAWNKMLHVPQPTFAAANGLAAASAAAQQQSTPFFVTREFLETAIVPPHRKNGTNVSDAEGYGVLDMIRNGVDIFMHPDMAPLFLYKGPVYMENQVDHLFENRKHGDFAQNEVLAAQIATAVSKSSDPEVQHRLLDLYSRLANHNPEPLNWGLSMIMATFIRSVDAMYGHTGMPRPICYAASKGTAEYINHICDNYASLVVSKSRADKDKAYAVRKDATSEVWSPFLDVKTASDAQSYSALPSWLSSAIKPTTRTNRFGKRIDDKKDDWCDGLALAIGAVTRDTRTRPYTRVEAPEVDYVVNMFNNACPEVQAKVREIRASDPAAAAAAAAASSSSGYPSSSGSSNVGMSSKPVYTGGNVSIDILKETTPFLDKPVFLIREGNPKRPWAPKKPKAASPRADADDRAERSGKDEKREKKGKKKKRKHGGGDDDDDDDADEDDDLASDDGHRKETGKKRKRSPSVPEESKKRSKHTESDSPVPRTSSTPAGPYSSSASISASFSRSRVDPTRHAAPPKQNTLVIKNGQIANSVPAVNGKPIKKETVKPKSSKSSAPPSDSSHWHSNRDKRDDIRFLDLTGDDDDDGDSGRKASHKSKKHPSSSSSSSALRGGSSGRVKTGRGRRDELEGLDLVDRDNPTEYGNWSQKSSGRRRKDDDDDDDDRLPSDDDSFGSLFDDL